MLAAVGRGGGLVTTRQLRDCGVPAEQIAAWVRRGRLLVVRHGVYTTRELWDSWDRYRDRPLALVRATELTIRIPHVFSHDSAALLQQVPLLRPDRAEPHVTRWHLRGSRTKAGVHHHGAAYDQRRVVLVDGLRALDVPRTVVDLTREHGYLAGLVAADGALQLGWRRTDLELAAEEMARRPFCRTVRAVVADADPGAESVLETLARDLIAEAGIGQAETQFPVRTPRGVAWVDLRVGRHLFEADGRVKLQAVDGSPLSDRQREQIMWDERVRQRDVCADGFVMTRFVHADFFGAERARTIARVQADHAHSVRTFGVELPAHVAEFAARMRGRRLPRPA